MKQKKMLLKSIVLTLVIGISLLQSTTLTLANTETTTSNLSTTSTGTTLPNTTAITPSTTEATTSTVQSTTIQEATRQEPITTQVPKVSEEKQVSLESTVDYTYAGCVQWVRDRTKSLFNYNLPYAGMNKYKLYGASAYWDYMPKVGYKLGKEPAKYALAVWEQTPYKIDGTYNYGHLALVEEVKGDTVTISQGGYLGGKWGKYNGVLYKNYKKSQVPGIARKFLGYIYLKEQPKAIQPVVAKKAVNAAPQKTTKPTSKAPTKKATNTTQPTVKSETVYRVYHGGIQRHLYTKNLSEAKTLGQRGWKFEGEKFKAVTNGQAVYRLYHSGLREHLYTTNVNEKNVLSKNGWRYEGIAWYSSGKRPIYRLYHAGLRVHLYTADANEKNVLVGRGWKYEGISFYVQ